MRRASERGTSISDIVRRAASAVVLFAELASAPAHAVPVEETSAADIPGPAAEMMRPPSLKLGRMGEVKVDSRMNISVVLDLRGRSRREVATNFLAVPSRAARFTRGNRMTIPFDELAAPYKAIAIMRLLPQDRRTNRGIEHVVRLEGETQDRIAVLYTGSARNAAHIRATGTVGEVSITRDSQILVTIPVADVEDTDVLARAVLKDPNAIGRMIQGTAIVIPITEMKDAYRAGALYHLFYDDAIREDVRRHLVTLPIESLFRISLWFTGTGNNWGAIKEASHKRNDEVPKGETILIPQWLLGSWAMLTEDDDVAETGGYPLAFTSRSRQDQIELGQCLVIPRELLASWTSFLQEDEDAAQEKVGWFIYCGTRNGPLAYDADQQGGFALYRLRRGEALYSSIVVRFTGIMTASEVLEIADDVLRRSGYHDPRRLPVNARIKIPIALLSPEWRPEGDPSREAESTEKSLVAKIERVLKEEQAVERRRQPEVSPGTRRRLDQVTVILDAGHGGRDPGAMGTGGLTENEVAYDILCRVRRLLRNRTNARVLETIEDEDTRYEPSQAVVIHDNRNESLKTTPRYRNGNIVASANLRWYLANAYVRQAVNDGRDLDKVVFASFHADALHSSIRGVMVYIPSALHCGGRYDAGSRYRSYREVRQRPAVSFSQGERLRSQAMSQRLAEHVVQELRGHDVLVHAQKPIRGYIIRRNASRAWVPAVIRYNAASTKLLVEVGNIKNARDAANMRDPAWRERFAQAFVDALVAQFSE